jgi:predicted Zn-dependent peptidase
MVLGLGGRVGDDVLEQASELFGDMAATPTGEPSPVQPHRNGRVSVFTKQSDQAHVILGVPSYPIDHPDRYALMMVASILGGGMSSRLFTEVRERRGLAYYVHGLNHSYTDTGSLYSQAGVDIKRIDDAVTTIAGELRKMAAEPVPADEFAKAKAFSKGRFVLELESPQGLILFGLRREVLEGDAPDLESVLDEIEKVTVEDVQRVAADLIRDDALRLAVIGPFDDAAHFEALL